MPDVPTLTLNNGVEIPQLGFGVFQVPPDEVVEPVSVALEAGYRLIDTAAAYGNEEGVGKAIADSGVAREEIFVTTKLWNDDQGYDTTLAAFDTSMTKLGLDVLDLYLVHWPAPRKDRYVESYRAMEKLYADGRVRAIGVCNFTEHYLNRLLAETSVVPAVNQVELHPGFIQADLRAYNDDHDIATEAWSPIGQGQGLLDDPTLARIADRHGVSPAQVVIRWHLDIGNVVIPKSATPSRIRDNIDVLGIELTPADRETLDDLDGYGRVGPDPDDLD